MQDKTVTREKNISFSKFIKWIKNYTNRIKHYILQNIEIRIDHK